MPWPQAAFEKTDMPVCACNGWSRSLSDRMVFASTPVWGEELCMMMSSFSLLWNTQA
jgi:hypothetical protein